MGTWSSSTLDQLTCPVSGNPVSYSSRYWTFIAAGREVISAPTDGNHACNAWNPVPRPAQLIYPNCQAGMLAFPYHTAGPREDDVPRRTGSRL
ncbi:hypothetical protein BDA96_06G112300 [Sorghum bicolor]|uniref:Uncharacterized protein n=1 Tax=Sorghum bicolor TaxID=4558 RepID=A0A921QSX1_SORBI|nr:hypothetical protein BDA96_06G112300 [Sorghum bicolor]